MSIFAVAAVPNRIQGLGRTISAQGPMSRADLEAFVAPREKAGEFKDIVKAAIGLGFLREDNSQGLSLSVPEEIANDVEKFRSFCFEQLITLSPERNGKNSSFPRAAAWFLSRPIWPQLPFGKEVASYIKDDLEGDDDFGLSNYSPWQMFCYWAQFLGLMERSGFEGELCSADPARAIESIARSNLRPGTSFTTRQFLTELSSKIPVLEGGVFREEIEGRSKNRRYDHDLSPATSHALLRLEAKGTLSLGRDSDAEMWTLQVTGDGPRGISKVSLKAKE